MDSVSLFNRDITPCNFVVSDLYAAGVLLEIDKCQTALSPVIQHPKTVNLMNDVRWYIIRNLCFILCFGSSHRQD